MLRRFGLQLLCCGTGTAGIALRAVVCCGPNQKRCKCETATSSIWLETSTRAALISALHAAEACIKARLRVGTVTAGPGGTVHWGTVCCLACLASCYLVMRHFALQLIWMVSESTFVTDQQSYDRSINTMVSIVSLCGETINQRAELQPVSCRFSARRSV